MSYVIYGKVIEPCWIGQRYCGTVHKTFRALNEKGVRVNRLTDAYKYDTKEEAQTVIDRAANHDSVLFETRKK